MMDLAHDEVDSGDSRVASPASRTSALSPASRTLSRVLSREEERAEGEAIWDQAVQRSVVESMQAREKRDEEAARYRKEEWEAQMAEAAAAKEEAEAIAAEAAAERELREAIEAKEAAVRAEKAADEAMIDAEREGQEAKEAKENAEREAREAEQAELDAASAEAAAEEAIQNAQREGQEAVEAEKVAVRENAEAVEAMKVAAREEEEARVAEDAALKLRRQAMEVQKLADKAEQEAWSKHDEFEEAEERLDECKKCGGRPGLPMYDQLKQAADDLETESSGLREKAVAAKIKAKAETVSAQLAREEATRERSEASQARIAAEREEAEAYEATETAKREKQEAAAAAAAAQEARKAARIARETAVRERQEAIEAQTTAAKEIEEAEAAYKDAAEKKAVLAAAREKAAAEQREADEARAEAERERAEAEEAKAIALRERAEADAAKLKYQMSICRKFAMHWLTVTQARASQRLIARQLRLRKDGRPADYYARRRRDQLATRARELRAKPPLFSPFGGVPGAKARFPEKVAFERLEDIRRSEAAARRQGSGTKAQGAQAQTLPEVGQEQSAWHTPRWALSEQNIFGTMEPQLSSLRTPRHIDGRKALISRLALKDPSSVFAQQERALERGLGDCHNAFRPAPAPSLAGFWSSRGPSPFPAPLLIPKPPNTSRQRHRICQRGTHRLLPPGGRHSQARAEAKLLQPHSATAF